MSFQQFGFNKHILKCLETLQYSEPTPIQKLTIPAALEGRDIVGLAQTGTGKTAAFVLPILSRLAQDIAKSRQRKIRALIISPTRELSAQIHDMIRQFTMRVPLRSALVVGGVSYARQKQALQHGVDILVGTPGRLIDMIKQGIVDPDHVESLVLDEADLMFDVGFLSDIQYVMEKLPADRQTLLFSATMSKDIRNLIDRHLHAPCETCAVPKSATADRIRQTLICVEKSRKPEATRLVLNTHADDQAIIFTRTKHGADKVAQNLDAFGIKAGAIHGNKSHNQRTRTLLSFRTGKIRVLVASDIAARGIDVPGVGLVLNYDLPEVAEVYIHRIGRTARAGKTGTAISLVSPEELCLLDGIQRLVKSDIPATDLEGNPVNMDMPRPPARKKPYHNRRSKSRHRATGDNSRKDSSNSNARNNTRTKSKEPSSRKRKHTASGNGVGATGATPSRGFKKTGRRKESNSNRRAVNQSK